MTRKIDPAKPPQPREIDDVTSRKSSSRPPNEWPGIEGRSEEDEATFVRESQDEPAADVTEAQRELERNARGRKG